MNRISNHDANGPDRSDARISLAGSLLVATPAVTDGFYARSVCIVLEHSPERAVGILLNRPMDLDASVLWDKLLDGKKEENPRHGHFNFGGPQDGPVLAIHNEAKFAEGGNNQGVYLSAQADTLKKLALAMPEHLRLYIGHAVWEKSQLENEIIRGDWYVMAALPGLVFADEQRMWARSIELVGRAVISDLTGIEQFPASPLLN